MRENMSHGTRGHWGEYDTNVVRAELFRRAGDPDLHGARGQAEVGEKVFEEKRDQLISILTTACSRYEDQFLTKLLDDAKAAALVSAAEYIRYARPSGQLMSRDSLAFSQGLWTPPHFEVVAEIVALRSPALGCEILAKIALRAASHLERLERQQYRAELSGTNVFIGHGTSPMWKDLKDFIQDRLRLPWDEFNRVPVAGITNIARLSEMLDAAAIALLVMTAEDEQADGRLHARMNVVHEAGLFQGRLGFSKAVILLEDGCEQFSNIEGLGQIRFPKGDIKACFEEVRKVLEREDLLES
jgi:predicted nucleotide-binding protein